jgi:drug/metabolite transporter (DMT)-like permease
MIPREGEMPSDDSRYWFPAKRYGWGWGPPVAWQGWAVLAGFFTFVIAGIFLVPPQRSMPAFAGYMIALTVVLTAICWLKGEPPRWRWGDDT